MGIRFDGVTVAYDGNVVLDAFDLTVAAGEVMALLGPSGSGKTTALRAVAGFVRPAAGRVFLGDLDVTDLPPHRRGIGMVVQSYALFPHMRVEENVAFGLKARKVPKAEIRTRVAEALEMTGMAAHARRHPRELSGGQQQRVAIARALAITEWRGWSFTTDEFWTQAQRDENRECNVRARNVFAVADGDEWNDKALTGTFDSTLVSPACPVTGGPYRHAHVHHLLPAAIPAEGRGPRLLRRRHPRLRPHLHHRHPLTHRDRRPPGPLRRNLGPRELPLHRREQLVLGHRRSEHHPVLTRSGCVMLHGGHDRGRRVRGRRCRRPWPGVSPGGRRSVGRRRERGPGRPWSSGASAGRHGASARRRPPTRPCRAAGVAARPARRSSAGQGSGAGRSAPVGRSRRSGAVRLMTCRPTGRRERNRPGRP